MKNSQRQQTDISMSKTSETSSNKHCRHKKSLHQDMLCTNILLSLIKNNKNNSKCQKRCLGFFGCRCNQINLLVLSLHKTLKLRQLVNLFSLNSNEFSLFLKLPHEIKSLLNSKLSCKPHATTMLLVVHLTIRREISIQIPWSPNACTPT